MSENKVLKKVYDPKRNEVRNFLYRMRTFVTYKGHIVLFFCIVKCRKLRWSEHIAQI